MLPPEWDAADWERAEVSWISSSWDLSRRLDPSKHSEEQSRAWPTFSIAVGAHGLHLLHHARGQLPDHDAHAPAPARVALLNGAGLPSLPAAHSTGCIKRKFFRKKPETPCSSRLACQHAQLHCPLQLGPLLSHPAPTQPLNSSSSINSIIQVQQFAGQKTGSSKSNTDKDLTQEILHYTICQQSNQRTQKYKQTYPLHALQRTFLLSCSLVVFPLYRSSKETLQNKVFLLGYHLTTYVPHVIKTLA